MAIPGFTQGDKLYVKRRILWNGKWYERGEPFDYEGLGVSIQKLSGMISRGKLVTQVSKKINEKTHAPKSSQKEEIQSQMEEINSEAQENVDLTPKVPTNKNTRRRRG